MDKVTVKRIGANDGGFGEWAVAIGGKHAGYVTQRRHNYVWSHTSVGVDGYGRTRRAAVEALVADAAARKGDLARTRVADICLYGTRATGAGWLASMFPVTGMLGSGDANPARSFTEAVWQAQRALTGAGLPHTTQVRIFDSGGVRMARATLGLIPAYGDLRWEAAPVYVLTEAGK